MNLQKHEIDNFKMYLDHDEPDGGVSNALRCHGFREKGFMDLIKSEIDKDDITADLGANIGYCTLTMAKKAKKVYAFEPNPDSFFILNQNIDLNGFNNIKSFKYALSNKKGKAKLYLSDKTNLCSMGQKEVHSGTTEVDTVSLNEFFKKKEGPNFVKMDIEGHELEVLQGMRDISENSKRLKILIEIHTASFDGEKFKRELKFLFENGFKTKYLISSGSADITEFPIKPIKSILTDNVTRHLFKDISDIHTLDLTTRNPQVVRSILLEKL